MNRYTEAGVLYDMRAGDQVLVLSESTIAARAALTDTASLGLWADERLRRANGQESIQSPSGGSIRFRSIASDLRGHIADVIVIDADPNRHSYIIEELRHTVCPREVIRP